MSDVQTLYVSRAAAQKTRALPELTRVTITASVVGDDGHTVPAGSVGTIVAIWADGEAYDVEFTQPVEELATIRADGLRAI